MVIWIVCGIFAAAVFGLCGMCIRMSMDMDKLQERYIKLEEWAEDWLKRLEQKCEANEDHIARLTAKIVAMEDLLPKNGSGEIIRNQILLQQMNDEMERSLRMEKEWNDGVSAILNYGKPITEVNKNE